MLNIGVRSAVDYQFFSNSLLVDSWTADVSLIHK